MQVGSHLSEWRTLAPVARSPEELDTTESLLSPLLPLSLPGPQGRPHPPRRTTVGELSLDVVSGALLSMLAMPAECFFVVLKFVQRNLASHALKFSSQPGLEAPSLRSPLSPALLHTVQLACKHRCSNRLGDVPIMNEKCTPAKASFSPLLCLLVSSQVEYATRHNCPT